METRDVTATESEPAGLGGWNPITGLPLWGVPAFFGAVGVLAAVLSALVPAFHARVVWQYYWGPIRADALGVPFAVHDGVLAYPGFNLVNTVSWIVLTVLLVLWSLQIIHACGIRRNDKFVFGCASWIVIGSVGHVLQDTGLFARPLEYFFITPSVFVLYYLGGVASITLGVWASRVHARSGPARAVALLAVPPALFAAAWVLLQWRDAAWIAAWVHPGVVPALSLVTIGALAWRVRRSTRVEPTEVVGFMALPVAGLHVAYVLAWASGTRWGDLPARGVDAALPAAFLLAPALTLLVIGAVVAVIHSAFRARHPGFAASFLLPLNLLVAGSQVLDGVVTAMGMDLRGYTEKHVLPRFLIARVEEWGVTSGVRLAAEYPAFLVFPALKLVIACVLLAFAGALFGRASRTADGERAYAPWHLGALFGIVVVGLAPAVRNLVRLTLGV